jgi:transcriptional antiterminator RfaH
MTDPVMNSGLVGDEAHVGQDTPSFWYVAQTKPRQERLAKGHLERQGYRVQLPLACLRAGQRRGSGSSNGPALEVLFPGYIFFAPQHPEQSIAPVRSTVGVTRLVRFGQQVATLSSGLLADVLAFVEHCTQLPGGLAARVNGVAQGKRVEIVEGPFVGYQGLVRGVGRERVMVLLDILGRTQSLGFSQGQLRAV